MRLITDYEFEDYKHLWKGDAVRHKIGLGLLLAMLIAAIILIPRFIDDSTDKMIMIFTAVFCGVPFLIVLLNVYLSAKDLKRIKAKEIYLIDFKVIDKKQDTTSGSSGVSVQVGGVSKTIANAYILDCRSEEDEGLLELNVSRNVYNDVEVGDRILAFYIGQPYKRVTTFQDKLANSPELQESLLRQGINIPATEPSEQKWATPNYYEKLR